MMISEVRIVPTESEPQFYEGHSKIRGLLS
jgi:hypothetical protein